jgi:hypothetical protein
MDIHLLYCLFHNCRRYEYGPRVRREWKWKTTNTTDIADTRCAKGSKYPNNTPMPSSASTGRLSLPIDL